MRGDRPLTHNTCPMRSTIILSLPLTILACGPCETTIASGGIIDLCPSTLDGGGGASGDSTGAADSESGGMSSTDDGEPTTNTGGCELDFGPGSLWGACVDDGCPNSPTPATCKHFDAGSICLPDCTGDWCPEQVAACGEGKCLDGACAPACIYGAKPKCERDGMVCDISDVGDVCVWPEDATSCAGANVPGQPFAPCLADATCDAPGTICATDSNGAVCLPISSSDCAEKHPGCAGPGGFGTGYGAQVDACTLACTGITDCAVDGMVCGATFDLCLWPN